MLGSSLKWFELPGKAYVSANLLPLDYQGKIAPGKSKRFNLKLLQLAQSGHNYFHYFNKQQADHLFGQEAPISSLRIGVRKSTKTAPLFIDTTG